MYPISFCEDEVVYAKNQSQYNPLPSEKWKDGHVVSKWKMTWKERIHCLFKGYFFLNISTFNSLLQPVRLSIERPEETRGY